MHDSRAYGGFTCNSDHKPVIAKLIIEWKTNIKQKTGQRRINSQEINKTEESLKQYQEVVRKKLQEKITSDCLQERWNAIKECTTSTSAAIEIAGYKDEKRKSDSNKIKDLSNRQKHLHHKIKSTNCLLQKKEIKKE